MKAKIEINMDNAAFDEPGIELGKILRDLAKHLENGDLRLRRLHDSNGNSVGELKIIGRKN